VVVLVLVLVLVLVVKGGVEKCLERAQYRPSSSRLGCAVGAIIRTTAGEIARRQWDVSACAGRVSERDTKTMRAMECNEGLRRFLGREAPCKETSRLDGRPRRGAVNWRLVVFGRSTRGPDCFDLSSSRVCFRVPPL
jgi:hypothetical protein